MLPEPDSTPVVDDFVTVAELIDPDDGECIPLHGIQIVTFMAEDGATYLKWRTMNDPSVEELVTILERAKFLLQIREFMHHMKAHDGDDEES